MTHLDLLVLLVVVVLIFQRLYSVLGSRPKVEEKHIRLSKENAEKLYDILKSEADKMHNRKTALQAAPEELVPIDDEPTNEIDRTCRQIPGFDKERFLHSAGQAFRAISEAFVKGDIDILEMLVSKKLLKKFREVIESRAQNHITAETDFICFDKIEIIRAKIHNDKTAELTVEYVSQQVNILRDAQNKIIEGDENYIQSITDVWTFERALTSTSPNWILISTKK